MWNVNSVTRAASVPALAVSASFALMMVGSPWMSQRLFHLGFSFSISRASISLVAPASCFDIWLR